MSPADIDFPSAQITAVATFLGFAALLYVLHWQLRLWPRDRQMWSAVTVIFMTTIIVGLLCLRYLGGPPLSDTIHGNIMWWLWCLSVIGWAWETRKTNLTILKRKREQGTP